MNYLAHFHLAGDDPAMIGGALLGDFVKGSLGGEYHRDLERGIRLHRRIDAFSDTDFPPQAQQFIPADAIALKPQDTQ